VKSGAGVYLEMIRFLSKPRSVPGLIVLSICFAVGIATVLVTRNSERSEPTSNQPSSNSNFGPQTTQGSGASGADYGSGSALTEVPSKPGSEPVTETKALVITSKPRALYTDAARNDQIEGTVSLRVIFLANGTIGSVVPLSQLPDGLTENAIEAARSIKFVPKKMNGQPVSVAKIVEYNFRIY
jgi:TonB family protein